MDYAKKKPAGGIIFELRVDLGNCKTLEKDDPMMKTWQDNGFDSAWAPKGANTRGLEENCVKDPSRIKIVRAIAGHTGELLKMELGIGDDGKLVKLQDLQQGSCETITNKGICKACKKAVWSNQERYQNPDGAYLHKGCKETGPATCDVAGCSRATWNGDFGEQCCRTCKSSGGAKHGPDCEAKAKAKGGAGGSVGFEGWRPMTSVEEVRVGKAVRIIADEDVLKTRMNRTAAGATNAVNYASGHAGKEGEITEILGTKNARVKLTGGGTCLFPWDALLVAQGSICLEGAGGDKGSLCNGVYDVSGTHNGKPLYVQKGGKAKIYFNDFWKVGHNGDTGGWVYGVKSDAGKGALPPTTWRNDGYSGSDASPCPTLQFLSGIAAGCCVVTRENYCSGRNVVRGPSWEWHDQDGGTCLTCPLILCCLAFSILWRFLCGSMALVLSGFPVLSWCVCACVRVCASVCRGVPVRMCACKLTLQRRRRRQHRHARGNEG